MSEAPQFDVQPELPPAAPPTSGEFAARLASRLCHDFISPASAIISGLDLLDDPNGKDLQEEAMALIASSSKKLVDMLTFCRAAYGGSASAESFDSAELERLARSVFTHIRPDLDWAVAPQIFDKAAARVLLNLAEMAGGALPMGGTARVTTRTEDGWTAIMVEARGPRLRLDPQVAGGLKGEPAPAGPAGKWVQAYYVYNQVQEARGVVASEQTEERIAFSAALPAVGR